MSGAGAAVAALKEVEKAPDLEACNGNPGVFEVCVWCVNWEGGGSAGLPSFANPKHLDWTGLRCSDCFSGLEPVHPANGPRAHVRESKAQDK